MKIEDSMLLFILWWRKDNG